MFVRPIHVAQNWLSLGALLSSIALAISCSSMTLQAQNPLGEQPVPGLPNLLGTPGTTPGTGLDFGQPGQGPLGGGLLGNGGTGSGNPPLDLNNPDSAADAERAKIAQQVAEYLKAEKYTEAEKLLREAVEKNPDDAGAWFFLGGTLRLQEKLGDAIEAYGKAAQLSPDNGEVFLRRGIAWFHKQEYVIALLDFEAAAALSFGDPRPEFWKGLCLLKRKLPRLALASFSASIKADPEYVPAYVNRGLAYITLQDFMGAHIDMNHAIRLDPKNPTWYYYRGIAYAKNKDPERARASYAEALRLKPDYTEARQNLSVVESQSGQSTTSFYSTP